MPTVIKRIQGREILDSRGTPTVEVDVTLSSGIMTRASVPSGASTGAQEAVELRDGDRGRFQGRGVLRAVEHVHETLAPLLLGQDPTQQNTIDRLLCDADGSKNKGELGANALLAVSLAVAKAGAQAVDLPFFQYLAQLACPAETTANPGRASVLPMPMMNILNGGVHANNMLDVQEFMILPVGARSFSEALGWGVDVFNALKRLLGQKGHSTAVGDEGGFAPQLSLHEDAMELILEAIEDAGYCAGRDIYLGLDVASTELYHDGYYHLGSEGHRLSSAEFIDYLTEWVDKYPIFSIEDGLAEEDWAGWKQLTEQLGHRVQLVGDDVFVTHAHLLSRGIREGVANALLVKPNQVGTISETLTAVAMAQKAGYGVVLSHRSGETEDTSIADLAVGWSAGQIKTGSLCRTDRTAKYNQLLRIEAQLGDAAVYAGKSVFKGFLTHD